MKYFFVFLITLSFTACTFLSDNKNEQNAIQVLKNKFGGDFKTSKGTENKNDKKLSYFLIEISNSDLLNQREREIHIPSSYIAFIFYNQLPLANQNKYDIIKVKIKTKSFLAKEIEYDTKEIIEAGICLSIIKSVENDLKSKDYNSLLNKFSQESSLGVTNDKIKNYASKNDSIYGQIDSIEFKGYDIFINEQDKRELLHYWSEVHRNKKNTPLNMYLDNKTKKLLVFKFE